MYFEDLAYIHHTGFRDFIDGAGPEIIQLFRERTITEGLVIDIGCGGGLFLRQLLDAGYRAKGIDVSPEMIRLAKAEAPEAEVEACSVHEFDIPECSAVTALGEVFSYLQPDGEREPDLAEIFRKIYLRLKPGGLLVFDVMVKDPDNLMNYRNFTTGEGWAVLVAVSEDPAKKQITREITTFRKRENNYRRQEEIHHVRVFSESDLITHLTDIGFQVTTAPHYGNFPLLPRRLAFLASKPKLMALST